MKQNLQIVFWYIEKIAQVDIEIHTRFRPPFGVGLSQRYLKRGFGFFCLYPSKQNEQWQACKRTGENMSEKFPTFGFKLNMSPIVWTHLWSPLDSFKNWPIPLYAIIINVTMVR